MGKRFCEFCNQTKDESEFNEEVDIYRACINCLPIAKTQKAEKDKIEEARTMINLEYEFQRIINNEEKEYVIGKGFIEEDDPQNDINNKYLEMLFNTVNKINQKLDNFIEETRKTLNDILGKYKIDDKKSKCKLLNYEDKTVNLREALELYHSLNDEEFKRVMLCVYNLTHKREIKSYTKKVKEWSNKYPDIVNRKINSIQNKLKSNNVDPAKSKAQKELYYSKKMINFRLPTIRKMLEARGKLNISDFSIEDSLKANYKWENEDIVNDLIAHENDNPDNDINLELDYEQREPSEFEIMGSYTSPTTMNTRDILNRYN